MSFAARVKSLFKSRYSTLIAGIICLVSAYLVSISTTGQGAPGVDSFVSTLHSKEKHLIDELDSLVLQSQGKTYNEIFLEDHHAEHPYPDEGIVLLIYQGDTLKYWSDNSAAVENYMQEVCLDQRMTRLHNGWFETVQKTDNSGRTFVGLLLIKNEYPYENQYLVNSFANGFRMPPETEIEIGTPTSTTAIHSADGSYLFSLVFKQEGNTGLSVLQIVMNILLTLLGAGFLIAFLRKESSSLKQQFGTRWPALIFVCGLILLRWLTILIHYPASFYDLPLYSPIFTETQIRSGMQILATSSSTLACSSTFPFTSMHT